MRGSDARCTLERQHVERRPLLPAETSGKGSAWACLKNREIKEIPYEIHFLSFDSEQNLNDFMQDDSRLQFLHLKNKSVQSMLLVKGQKM